MKAKITHNNGQFLLTLEPEFVDDKEALHDMSLALERPNMINCRGFGYMKPSVEFLIQPMPSRD